MEASQARTEIDAGTLGRYRLLVGLGRGGMAVVHLAVMHGQGGFNKLLVIKQINEQFTVDPEILGMFLDEARLAARLSHPNVVQTNEVGQDGERHYLTMEYLDGQPLNRILWRMNGRGGLPLGLHLRVIADVLGGLHYAHELADYDGAPLGVVHRDVTPHNVFVTYDGTVKVVDFGIAKARDSATHTKVGIIKGKIAYMAPEQARGEPVDRRADIFAAGVMLWEALTGMRPWKGQSELTILKKLLAGEFPSARAINPEIPARLEAILLKALAPDRKDRYATAAAFQADIEAYLETTGRAPEHRELGRLVSVHFQAERAKIQGGHRGAAPVSRARAARRRAPSPRHRAPDHLDPGRHRRRGARRPVDPAHAGSVRADRGERAARDQRPHDVPEAASPAARPAPPGARAPRRRRGVHGGRHLAAQGAA